MRIVNMLLLVLAYLSVMTVHSSITPKSGPFISVPFSLRVCDKPSRPYMKKPPLSFYVEFHNVSDHVYLRGNLTTTADAEGFSEPVLTKARVYRVEYGRLKIVKTITSSGCRGLIATSLGYLFGIKYNKKTCTPTQGTFHFNNVNMDQLDHIWSSKREYGQYLVIFEYQTPNETILCRQYETQVVPLKKKRLNKADKTTK